MTRMTLSEACLMEASGELSPKTHAKLQAHIDKYPRALLEFEIARGNLELLRSLPKVQLSEDQKKQIVSNIKVGIQQKLWQARHEKKVARRWKIAYRSLAAVSGIAAAVVISAGVLWIEDQNNQRATRNAEQLVKGYLSAGEANETENQIGVLRQDIADLLKNLGTTRETPSTAESKVLNLIGDENTTASDIDLGSPEL